MRPSAFYDTFIGPAGYHRDLDIVSGTVVLRDPNSKVAWTDCDGVHSRLRATYDRLPASGRCHLRAYWEVARQFCSFCAPPEGHKTRHCSSGAAPGNQGWAAPGI